MTREKFEKLVKEGIGDIHQKLLDRIDNVGVVIEIIRLPSKLRSLN